MQLRKLNNKQIKLTDTLTSADLVNTMNLQYLNFKM